MPQTYSSDFSVNPEFGEVVPETTPIFLLDMDGVLADLEGWLYKVWTVTFPDEPLIPRVDRREFYMDVEHPTSYHDRMRDMLCRSGAFRFPEPIPGGIEAAHRLAEIGVVYVCTSPMFSNLTCMSDKVWWVDKYLGPEWKDRVILCKDKTTVRGTILFDDRPKVEGRLVPIWEHVVFGQPYNAHVEGTRVEDWPDAMRYVEERFS